MATFQVTETVTVKGTIRDDNGDLTTPATSTKITITNSEGTKVVDDLAVSFSSIGIWQYLYTPASNAVLGAHHVRVIGTDSARVSIKDSQFFLVS